MTNGSVPAFIVEEETLVGDTFIAADVGDATFAIDVDGLVVLADFPVEADNEIVADVAVVVVVVVGVAAVVVKGVSVSVAVGCFSVVIVVCFATDLVIAGFVADADDDLDDSVVGVDDPVPFLDVDASDADDSSVTFVDVDETDVDVAVEDGSVTSGTFVDVDDTVPFVGVVVAAVGVGFVAEETDDVVTDEQLSIFWFANGSSAVPYTTIFQ